MIFEGQAHVLGDNVDTDGMIAGRYLSLSDPEEIARHMFEESDPGFRSRVKPGDILFTGINFGSGSGREHAPLGLKTLGIRCIVAASFARTFYRMAVDLGIPPIICPDAARAATAGQTARIDTVTGEIVVGDQVFHADPLPAFICEIVEEGGMVNWVKKEVQKRHAEAHPA